MGMCLDFDVRIIAHAAVTAPISRPQHLRPLFLEVQTITALWAHDCVPKHDNSPECRDAALSAPRLDPRSGPTSPHFFDDLARLDERKTGDFVTVPAVHYLHAGRAVDLAPLPE
jgi:hypothetical protein